MNPVTRFWRQPSVRYRNFQIVFTILTLNFAIPTISYVFAPHVVQEQFAQLNLLLGGSPYTFPEAQSRFWRYLGAANVATLALMCGLLQYNLRRYFPTLVPLVFMKGTCATLWLAGFLATPQYPAFLAAAILDYVSTGAFIWFATRAHRDLDDLDDPDLTPRPSPLQSWHRETANVVLRAILPTDTDLEARTRPRFARPGGRRLGLGFGLAVWAIALAPILSKHHRPLWRLSYADRDAFVTRLAASPTWVVRQLVEVVKLVACFSYFADGPQRARWEGQGV